jgi:acyl carrier protein
MPFLADPGGLDAPGGKARCGPGSVAARLAAFVEELGGLRPGWVTTQTRWSEEIGPESLDDLQLLLRIEEEFGITIAGADAERFRTVGDTIHSIEGRLKSCHAAS